MFVSLFALLLAVLMLVAGAGYVRVARRMRFYKRTIGKVVFRDVVAGGSFDTREGVWGDGGGHVPSVRYRYVVNGTEHESEKIGYARRGLKRALAERALASIPDEVTVWYDPANPAEAYLERHAPTLGYLLVAGGLIGAMFAVVSLATR